MSCIRRGIMLLLVVFVATSCTRFNLKEARAGLEATLADLPESEEFTVIASLSGEADRTFGGKMCYFAQSIMVVGSPLPEKAALANYVQDLQEKGWRLKRRPIEYETEKMLIRGEHESIIVDIDAPSWMLGSAEEFQRARDQYVSFVNVTVNYYLPSRLSCMGE